MLEVSVKGTGKYSATLKMNGHTYLWSGTFDKNGATTKKIPASTLTAKMTIGLQTSEITGTLLDGADEVTDISLSRAMSGTATIAPYQGHYTFVFQPNAGDLVTPQADGFGTLTVSKKGLITASGKLADGTKFSEVAALTQEAGWPLYVALYKKKGFVSGLITIDPAADEGLSGAPIWLKAGASGFTTALPLTGMRFDSATFDFKTMAGKTITLSGGGLVSPSVRPSMKGRKRRKPRRSRIRNPAMLRSRSIFRPASFKATIYSPRKSAA